MKTLLFIGNLGAGEIVIIALVILLLFGGKKIPELMKGIRMVSPCSFTLQGRFPYGLLS